MPPWEEREFIHNTYYQIVGDKANTPAGDDKLTMHLLFEKVTSRMDPEDGESLVESTTKLADRSIDVKFSHLKLASSNEYIKSFYKNTMMGYLLEMGVPEALFKDITDSVFVVIDKAISCEPILVIKIWDLTTIWPDEPAITAASKSSIEGLEWLRLEQLQDHVIRDTPTCAICLDDFSLSFEEQVVVRLLTRLPCSHLYHRDCIVKWLDKCNLCPMCRYPMPPEEAALA